MPNTSSAKIEWSTPTVVALVKSAEDIAKTLSCATEGTTFFGCTFFGPS